MREIIPARLWIGNAIDARNVSGILRLGAAVIVDLAIEEPPIQLPRDVTYCRFPLIDGAGNQPDVLRAAIETVARFIASGTPTLVACGAGMSRSPAVVAAAMATTERTGLADALERLTAGQPHDVSPGLLAEIAQLVHPEPQRDKEDAVDHDTVVEDWRRNAASHDDENYEFLRGLKFRDYGFDPDELAAELHARVFQALDCTRCANCCKTLDTKVTSSDAERIAEHLNVTTMAFADAYLATDEFGDRKFRQRPCPFLGEDGRCRIYSVRPADCWEYPHTDKKWFTSRTITHANNALTRPAVYWIVEQMRIRSRNQRPKPRRSDSRSRR